MGMGGWLALRALSSSAIMANVPGSDDPALATPSLPNPSVSDDAPPPESSPTSNHSTTKAPKITTQADGSG